MALLYDYYTKPAFGSKLEQKPSPNAERIMLDGTEQFPDPESNPWSPSWYDGLGSAFLLGARRGLLGVGATALEIGSGALTGWNDDTWAYQLEEKAKSLRAERNQYKLDERTTSEFSNIVSGVVEGLTGAAAALPAAGAATVLGGGPVAAGLTAAAFYGLQTGVDTFATNRDEGVDKGTAAQMGLISGVTNAIGMALPAGLGRSIVGSTLYGVGSNMGLGIGERTRLQKLLRERGYETKAEQYDPTDSTSLIVEGIMGGVFGAIGRSRLKDADTATTTGENAKASPQPGKADAEGTPPDGSDGNPPAGGGGGTDAQGGGGKAMTQEQTDAVRVLEVEAANKENLPVNNPEDSQSVDRATKAQQDTHDQILNKEPVDVDPNAADAEKVEALQTRVAEKINDELNKDAPNPAEGRQPHRAALGQSVGDVVRGLEGDPGFIAHMGFDQTVEGSGPVVAHGANIPDEQKGATLVFDTPDGPRAYQAAVVELNDLVTEYNIHELRDPRWLYSPEVPSVVNKMEELLALREMYRKGTAGEYRESVENFWRDVQPDKDLSVVQRMEEPVLVCLISEEDFATSGLNPHSPAARASAAREAEAKAKAKRESKAELARERRIRELEEENRAFAEEEARMPRPVAREVRLINVESNRKGGRGVSLFAANGDHRLGWLPKNAPGIRPLSIILDWDTYSRINKRNGSELTRAGYPTAGVAIEDLIQTYTRVHKGDKPNSVVISKPLPNHRILYGTLFLGKDHATFGQVWISDFPKYTQGKQLLWIRPKQPVPGGVEPSAWQGARPGEVIGSRPAREPTPPIEAKPTAQNPGPEAPAQSAPEVVPTASEQPVATPAEASPAVAPERAEPAATAASPGRAGSPARAVSAEERSLETKTQAVLKAAPDLKIFDAESGQWVDAKALLEETEKVAKELDEIADKALPMAEICAFSNGGLKE